jgi:predicted nucleic acid-binding protein
VRLLLDTTVLTRLCHPIKEENQAVGQWLTSVLSSNEGQLVVCIPEISDYEARRGLLHVALRSDRLMTRSLERLDQLRKLLTYLPLTTPAMRRAALLWAQARKEGRPTGGALDGDAILAAQALEIHGAVVTENVRHFGRVVATYRWQEVPLPFS